MEYVTSENGSYGRCYVNKITEGVPPMRRAIYGRNYPTRTIVMKAVMSMRVALMDDTDMEGVK